VADEKPYYRHHRSDVTKPLSDADLKLDQTLVDYALSSWRHLNEVINTMTITELKRALELEAREMVYGGRRRKQFLIRLTAKVHEVERRRQLQHVRGRLRQGNHVRNKKVNKAAHRVDLDSREIDLRLSRSIRSMRFIRRNLASDDIRLGRIFDQAELFYRQLKRICQAFTAANQLRRTSVR
jgi:hypothetical protein